MHCSGRRDQCCPAEKDSGRRPRSAVTVSHYSTRSCASASSRSSKMQNAKMAGVQIWKNSRRTYHPCISWPGGPPGAPPAIPQKRSRIRHNLYSFPRNYTAISLLFFVRWWSSVCRAGGDRHLGDSRKTLEFSGQSPPGRLWSVGLGTAYQRRDRMTNVIRQPSPGPGQSLQIGVEFLVFTKNCAAFCAACYRDMRFSRGIAQFFGSSSDHWLHPALLRKSHEFMRPRCRSATVSGSQRRRGVGGSVRLSQFREVDLSIVAT